MGMREIYKGYPEKGDTGGGQKRGSKVGRNKRVINASD